MSYMILLLLAMVHTVIASQSADGVAQPGAPNLGTCRDVIAKCQQDVSKAQLLVADFDKDIAKLTKEIQRKMQMVDKPFKNITNDQNDVRATSLVRGMEQGQALTLKSQVEKLQSLYKQSHASFDDTVLLLLHLLQSRDQAEAVQQREASAWQEYNALMTELASKTSEASSKLVGHGIEIGTLQQKISDSEAALKHANEIVDASKNRLLQICYVCGQAKEPSICPLDGRPDEAAQAMMDSLDLLSRNEEAGSTERLEMANVADNAQKKAERLKEAQQDLAWRGEQPQKVFRQSQRHMPKSQGRSFLARPYLSILVRA